jgi:hypothetical protein
MQNQIDNRLHNAAGLTTPVALVQLDATSFRYHLKSVSGVTRVSSSFNTLRPSA